MNDWAIIFWLVFIGIFGLFVSWGLVVLMVIRLRRRLGQAPELRDEIALSAELVRLREAGEAARQELSELRGAIASVSGERGGAEVELARVSAELRELRAEKKGLVDRVRSIKEEAHDGERRSIAAEAAAVAAKAASDQRVEAVALLKADRERLRAELERLRGEVSREESHAAELRRQREGAHADGCGRAESLAAEVSRLESAAKQKGDLLERLNRSISEAESRLNRYH